jgi:hypothetical protein
MKPILKVWEFLCIVLLGVPMMFLGYLGVFVYAGLTTGIRLHRALHLDSEKTSP